MEAFTVSDTCRSPCKALYRISCWPQEHGKTTLGVTEVNALSLLRPVRSLKRHLHRPMYHVESCTGSTYVDQCTHKLSTRGHHLHVRAFLSFYLSVYIYQLDGEVRLYAKEAYSGFVARKMMQGQSVSTAVHTPQHLLREGAEVYRQTRDQRYRAR